MKRKIIIIVLIALAFLLASYRFMLVEREDVLPSDMRSQLNGLFGSASAEGISAPESQPQGLMALLRRLFLHDTQHSAPNVTPEPTEEPTPAPTPIPTPAPTPQPLLESGHRGDEVRAMQERLRELGFMTSTADGQFGPKTEQAVVDFKNHLYQLEKEKDTAESPEGIAEPAPSQPDFEGKVDLTTYRLLLENGFDAYQEQLASGSQGAEVRRLQCRLKALNYLTGKADGVYGQQTVRAVTAFQKRHQLTQDGVAGERTQRLLFSGKALRQITPSRPYLLKISTAKQRVYAYAWSENDLAYTRLVRTMVCSTGLSKTPTPLGTFSANTAPMVRWGYFPKWDVWAQYLYRINGSILFHSVLYTDSNESSLIAGSRYKLGSPASHGCVRLEVEDAKWIYQNCPAGTTVKVV